MVGEELAGAELERIPLPYGWADIPKDPKRWVAVGNRLVPDEISAHFASGDRGASLSMNIQVRQGFPMLTSITLTADPNGPEVGAKDLKALRGLRHWVTDIVARCSWARSSSGGVMQIYPPTDADRENARRSRSDASRPSARPRRRNQISRELLAPIAETYRAHINGQPTKTVAEIHHLSERTAARYIEHCRSDEYQLLPTTTRGRKKA